MSNKLERTILPIGFVLLAAGLIFLWVKIEGIGKPEKPTPYMMSEPAGAEPASAEAAVAPTTYVSWHLTRGSGAIVETGATRVTSNAWRYYTQNETADPALFINDVIATLEKDGTLGDVDLGKRNSNWLIILWPGGSPRPWWILDSRDIPEKPREEE